MITLHTLLATGHTLGILGLFDGEGRTSKMHMFSTSLIYILWAWVCREADSERHHYPRVPQSRCSQWSFDSMRSWSHSPRLAQSMLCSSVRHRTAARESIFVRIGVDQTHTEIHVVRLQMASTICVGWVSYSPILIYTPGAHSDSLRRNNMLPIRLLPGRNHLQCSRGM